MVGGVWRLDWEVQTKENLIWEKFGKSFAPRWHARRGKGHRAVGLLPRRTAICQSPNFLQLNPNPAPNRPFRGFLAAFKAFSYVMGAAGIGLIAGLAYAALVNSQGVPAKPGDGIDAIVRS